MSLELLEFYFPGLDNVRCAFTTRNGGHSCDAYSQANMSLEVGDNAESVRANRNDLRSRLGFHTWQELRQVHGLTMYMDMDQDFFDGPVMEGDGLGTEQSGCALIVKSADCQPILLTDTQGRYVAALHCGWRGNVLDFPGHGVRAFCAHYQVEPAQILAVRGPSLGPGQSEFTNFETEWGPRFQPWYNSQTQCVDLWALTRSQLLDAGLRASHIFSLDLCTASSQQFFSYRRDQITGRQLSLIWKS